MKISLDIDCTPEELREFFGLPDVKPMQEQLLKEVEARMGANLQALEPEVMAYLPPPDAEWIDRAVAHWQQHGFGQWVVELPDDVSFIGVVGLSHVRFTVPFAPAVDAAWRLARPFWGKGYAFEAARAAIEDGFLRLGLAEIVAFTVPANRTSWQLM